MTREYSLLIVILMSLSAVSGGCAEEEEASCPPSGLRRCDPVTQRCCEAGERCVLYYSAGSYIDTCLGGEGSAGEGDPCVVAATSGATGCSAGLTCLRVTGVDSELICRRICRDDSDCLVGSCEVTLPGVDVLGACL